VAAPEVRPSTGTLPVPVARAFEVSPTVPAPATLRSHPEIKDGDPVARLEIPAINVDKVVVSGVDAGDLRRGPGHYLSTPLPGEIGNAGIAGHRTTAGAPFGDLDKLQPGDEIITTTQGGRFRFLVVRTKIVGPNDVTVLAPTTDVRLTLTTCHPRYSTAERLIVTAVLDPQSPNHPLATSAPPPTTPPTTAPVAPAAVTVPVVTVAVTTVAEVAVTTPPPTTIAATTIPTTTIPATTIAATTAPPLTSDLATDAMGRGWFSDDEAWPGVLLWGLALAAVAGVAWQVSRKTSRNWVGALVGIGPFVVVLYFWFENVDRLLPPNL
jgi:sortase A